MSYRTMPLGRQILLPAMLLLVLVFTIMIALTAWLTGQAAMAQAQLELGNEVRLVVGGLDSEFDSAKARGARQLHFFEQFLGGAVQPGEGLHPTGGLALPILSVNGVMLNSHHEPLERFKSLTSEEAAILTVYQGKVYRLSTLLKRDGKAMDGTALADNDPVARALLAGEDYQGMVVRNGKYYFSNIRALKNAQGQVIGGLSVRIELADTLARLRTLYGRIVAGKTGYVTIAHPSGDDKTIGEFIVHPKFQGKIIGEVVGEGPTRQSALDNIRFEGGLRQYLWPSEQGCASAWPWWVGQKLEFSGHHRQLDRRIHGRQRTFAWHSGCGQPGWPGLVLGVDLAAGAPPAATLAWDCRCGHGAWPGKSASQCAAATHRQPQ